VLNGSCQAPQPTVGRRTDGRGLFYAGKSHAVISETEAGKTWFALAACLDEIHAGHDVVFIDFEDDQGGVASRLLTMGARRDMIAQHFHYIRPESPLGSGIHLADLRDCVTAHRPALDIIDGVTEAMTMHGLNPLDNVDAAIFGRLLPRRLATAGAAVVSLDHVKKENDGRGRYALGAVHKLNALDGGAYILENRQPFGVGITGRSTIKIAKDRPGQLRAHGMPSAGGLQWYGDLVVRSVDQDFAEVSVEPPHERVKPLQPTKIMKEISDLLSQKGPLSQKVIRDLITGKGETVSKALSMLVADGYVDAKTPHKLLKPYNPKDDK
jgi:hypothetical protein